MSGYAPGMHKMRLMQGEVNEISGSDLTALPPLVQYFATKEGVYNFSTLGVTDAILQHK